MISNMELYGTEDIPLVPKEVCNGRLDLLLIHLKKLMSVHYMDQDTYTINKILEAQNFWKKLRDGETI